MTDKEILALYRSGETQKAFNMIVEAYSERMYWHIRSLVCSHEDADDLVQDVFVKIWAGLPSFRAEAQLSTWLYRIATNEALNFLNKQKVRAALSFERLSDNLERKIEDDPYFDGREAERLLQKAIQKLPKKQFVLEHIIKLKIGQEIEIDELTKKLINMGYARAEMIS